MLTYPVDTDIVLALHSSEDASRLYHVFQRSRASLIRWTTWANSVTSQSQLEAALRDDLLAMAEGRCWAWIVHYRGQVAGRIRLEITHQRQREGTLSFWLGQAYTGRSIMPRAMRAIIDWCFTELALHRLCIDAEPNQDQCIAVAHTLGFHYEMTLQQVIYRNGQWRDWQRYSVLHEEWSLQTRPIFAYLIADTFMLRLLQKHHATHEYALIDRNRNEMRRWFSWAEQHSMETEKLFLQIVLRGYAVGDSLTLGIWDDTELIGQVALTIERSDGHGQFGYFLDRSARGQGLVTRSVEAMMTWAFKQRRLNRLWLRAAVDNQASIAVAERVGMQREGVLHSENKIDGRWVDHAVYSILASEWRNRQHNA